MRSVFSMQQMTWLLQEEAPQYLQLGEEQRLQAIEQHPSNESFKILNGFPDKIQNQMYFT